MALDNRRGLQVHRTRLRVRLIGAGTVATVVWTDTVARKGGIRNGKQSTVVLCWVTAARASRPRFTALPVDKQYQQAGQQNRQHDDDDRQQTRASIGAAVADVEPEPPAPAATGGAVGVVSRQPVSWV